MGIVSEKIMLEHFSKNSFARLVDYIIAEIVPNNIHFAQKVPVSHNYIEIHPDFFFDIPLSGRKHIIYGDGGGFCETSLFPGDILFCRPFTWKQCKWDTPHEMACIIYKENFIRITYVDIPEPLSIDGYPKSTCFFHTRLPSTESIYNLLKALSTLSENSDPGNAAIDIMQGLLKLTLEMIKKDRPEKFSKSEITFHRLQQYIHDNFNANINRKYVSHIFNLHPGYVSRLYKENCQKSFFNTLYTLRMEHAELLLKNTEQKIRVISNSCGYESLPAFTVAFKKYSGLPPGKYRQLYRTSLPE